jgi:hypothetical protein
MESHLKNCISKSAAPILWKHQYIFQHLNGSVYLKCTLYCIKIEFVERDSQYDIYLLKTKVQCSLLCSFH